MKNILMLSLFLMSACAGAQSGKNGATNDIQTFVTNFSVYNMDIAAAGIAKITAAKLISETELFIAYAYMSGGENRNGKMTLHPTASGTWQGDWKTDADNGNSYSGTLYFNFTENGEATGKYRFGGADYRISINKKQ